MFDQAMWVAYLCTGVACGLLGLAFVRLAARDSDDARLLDAGGTALFVSGAVCSWIAAVVAVPERTSKVLVLAALICVVVIVTMVAASAPVRGVRKGGTSSDGAP